MQSGSRVSLRDLPAITSDISSVGRGHTLARLEEAIYRISTVIGLPDPTYVFDYLEPDPQAYREDADEEESSDQELKAKRAPDAFFLPKDAAQGVPQWTEIAVSGVYQEYASRKSVKDVRVVHLDE